MVDVSPFTSYISCVNIDGAPEEFLFNGLAKDQHLILYQTRPSWITTVDPYNMVTHKGIRAKLEYYYDGIYSESNIPENPYQFTGFVAPLSRKYLVKLLAYIPDFVDIAKTYTTYNFGTGDILRLVADIQPVIKVSKYGSDFDYYFLEPEDFSVVDYRKGLIFTSAAGSVPTNSVIPKLNSTTASYEVEINLDAGDFVGFTAAIVPQSGFFKIVSYSSGIPGVRYVIFMQASIRQIED